ncbi:MAG: urea carboxylase [Steroidobacteraceae bacterium]|jgi:urea carboxylase
MFRKVLIANRGEIACRIIRTLRRMGIGAVAVYSDADRHALHVLQADEAVHLGPSAAAQSYLRAEKLIEAARASGAQAIHPGYGFLSENAGFAELCECSGIAFIGPTPRQIRDFGLKHTARALAARAGVPLLPGSDLLADAATAKREAQRIGYPVMLKSSAGGGGIGMQLVRRESELEAALETVERLSRKNFSGGGVFLERYVEQARHIEVQIFGDGEGGIVTLGERDCSIQRRHQKVIEETPAAGLSRTLRADLHAAAASLGRAVRYRSAGTVEFVYDAQRLEFYFLEVNTRLQVEHCVTEEVTGVDLVEWMIRLAANDGFEMTAPVPRGTSIEARIYAEDPARNFRPSTGLLTQVRFASGARIETWVEDGTAVTPHYDPLLAKIVVCAADRADAVAALHRALEDTRLDGIESNLEYLRVFVASRSFAAGGLTTRALEGFDYVPQTIEVLSGGTQTTIQDHPGRLGYWCVGVPPSGPMDHWSFRLANRAVGNPPDAAALEITMSGPMLKFNVAAVICLTGAESAADIDGAPITYWSPVAVAAGATLRVGAPRGGGCRSYLAIRGGFDVPCYMGSRATFILGKFGGHGGRALLAGDVLHLGAASGTAAEPRPIPRALVPRIAADWELGVLDGPHGAPDFFTAEDIETFYASAWTVHYNSSRTGVRLIGPKPVWARSDGGEAGLHPSNIHDTAYAVGAVDFTGDMPVILGPDGPSLGGFVCPVTVVNAELWKLGQLRPDDRVRFRRLSPEEAAERQATQDLAIADLQCSRSVSDPCPAAAPRTTSGAISPILGVWPAQPGRPQVVYRRSGDSCLLIEFGPMVLDLELRLHAHVLMSWLERQKIMGIIDLTPGIRSLQVHYDRRVLPEEQLVSLLAAGQASLPAPDDIEIPSRIVKLPLSWDDDATRVAIEKYMQSVRADAPWCPSNIEFIRRINGLDSIDDVKRVVFAASYLVLGLGDVYLGAPVATPVDPRHRLVTTKYNPARTWTPENAVGIGGAYLCVYGMEGPGGYQFIGRTCQMWNTFKVTPEFVSGRPWLLRFFDQIRFYPVGAQDLLDFREDFLHGRARLEVEQSTFRLRDYRRLLAANRESIAAHKARQQSAFEAERERWRASNQIGDSVDSHAAPSEAASEDLPEDCVAVTSPVSGSVWRMSCTQGQSVRAGDTLVLVESMKMEIPVAAPVDGVIAELRSAEGRTVVFGQTLAVLSLGQAPGGHATA